MASLSNGGGTAGYMDVCTIKVLSTYANSPLVFVVSRRGGTHGNVNVTFANANSTDPSLSTFTTSGGIPAYIVKSTTSTWELYVAKSESYDCVDIVGLWYPSYDSGKLSVTWSGATVSSLPTDYVTASQDASTYLPLSGGTMTGNLTIASAGPNIELKPSNTSWGYGGFIDFHYNGSTADYTSRIIENASGQLAINSVTIKGSTVTGSLSGNASTATKLATARTIRTNLGSTSTASFDGSANVTPGITGTLPVANGGTGATGVTTVSIATNVTLHVWGKLAVITAHNWSSSSLSSYWSDVTVGTLASAYRPGIVHDARVVLSEDADANVLLSVNTNGTVHIHSMSGSAPTASKGVYGSLCYLIGY